ncbi:MAG TPA: hypothetical protein DDZ40_04515 [Deltaproteobacteria bacterium]|nr:hypothetical protein [Deltaproteobacteria bacterium]
MIIHKLVLSKTQFDLLPEKERILFVQIGHLANELTVLTKLLIFAHTDSNLEVVRRAYTMQASVIARICIGKLFEGWRLLENSLFATSLSKKYEGKLPKVGAEILENLKKYFGKKNLIPEIRNKFSFHNPSSEIINNLLFSIPKEAELHLYLGTQHANSNYYLSEEIISRAMLNCVQSDNLQQAMDKVYKELLQVSGWFVEFCGHCMATLAEEHSGRCKKDLRIEKIDVRWRTGGSCA